MCSDLPSCQLCKAIIPLPAPCERFIYTSVHGPKLLSKYRGESYVHFNANTTGARNRYQSSPRSTGGKNLPFPKEGHNHNAKEQITLPFSQWPLDSQLLLCSMAQLQQRGGGCPLGRGAHSLVGRAPSWAARGLDLSSLRLGVALDLHIKLPQKNASYKRLSSPWVWRVASILIIFYKERVLQNEGDAENITKLSKVGFMKAFPALLALSKNSL